MNCRETAELTPLYLSDELEAEPLRDFEAHLRMCPSCASEIAQQRRLDHTLRDAILDAPVDTSKVDLRVRQSIARPRWPIAAGIAAVLILGALALQLTSRPPPLATVYADTLQDHGKLARHKDWVSDRKTLKEIGARSGIPASTILGLAPAGYRLEHAKMCKSDGQPSLHLVYTDGENEVSIFLRPRVGDAPPPGTLRATVNGRIVYDSAIGVQHLAYFQTEQLMAMVVSDGPGDTAFTVARSMAQGM